MVVRGGGGDYHDQGEGHWIDDHIATAMSRYPEYRQSRQSFGINVLGTLVVEIEASDGTVGFAVTTGGEPAAYIVEKHLARFLEGRDPFNHELIWDQMYFATQYYGRKGLVLNAISGVDLALWDLMANCAVNRSTTCSAARSATSNPSMLPERDPTSPGKWDLSAASCRCIMAPPRVKKGSGSSSKSWPRCAGASAMISG